MTNKKALAALMVTLLLWSTSYVAIRDSLNYFTPGSLALLRYLIASVAIIPVYFSLSSRSKITRSELPRLFLLGAFGIGAYNILLNIGETTVSASIASFIGSQIPVATILLAILILHERLTKLSWVGLCVSTLGIALIASGETHQLGHFNHGVVLIILSVFCGAMYSVLQKPLLKRLQPLELTAWAIWFGALSLMGYLPTLSHEILHQEWWHFLWPTFLGAGSGVIGYACWSYGFKHFPATKAASFLFAMPIIATLMGWLVLAEVPTAISLIGGVVALSGAFMVRSKR